MIDFFVTPQQKDLIRSRADVILLVCGRRYGKNFGWRYRAIDRCLGRKNFEYTYCAPSYALGQAEWETIALNPGCIPFIAHSSKKDPYPIIRWKNGSVLHFRSLDRPRNLRGGGDDEIAIDEIQDADEDIIESVVKPRITDRFGTLVMMGQFSPYVYDKYYLRAKKNSNIKVFHHPTTDGIRFQGEKGKRRLADLKEDIPPTVWDQEYMVIPGGGSRGVFRHEKVMASKVGGFHTIQGSSTYVAGLDLGMIEDPAALAIVDAENSTVVYSQEFPLGQDHMETAQQVAGILSGFGNPTCLMDETGGATGGKTKRQDEYTRYYREYYGNIRGVVWTKTYKTRMVRNLSLAFENGEIKVDEKNQGLLDELVKYTYTRRKNGDYDYHGPSGKKDNYVAALMMAWDGFKRGWFNTAPTESSMII